MSARVCRLCGKPLSRMRVSGDEFCSREHQNQFRLRQGMDRLMEANKVASLMRRRENPKPIGSAAPPPDAAAARRAFLSARLRAALAEIALPQPRAGHSWESAAACPPARWAGASPSPLTSREVKAAARFFARSAIVPSSPARAPAAARFPQARVALFRVPGPLASGKRRQFGMAGRPAFRISIGSRVFQFHPADGPGAKYGGPRAGARPMPATAREGRALRVSASAGFRLPALEKRLSSLAPELAAGPGTLDARPGKPVAPGLRAIALRPAARAAAVGLPVPALSCPPAPPARMAYGFPWPGTIALPAREPRDSSGAAARAWGSKWDKPEGCVLPQASGTAQPARFPAAGIRAVRPPGAPALAGERRVAVFGFVPQEAALGTPPLTIQGAAVGAPVSKPRANPPGSQSTIEEHFAAGWGEWTGGVDDWKLDAAGVRTGSLALFRPSLELRDYELEFLARIENRSVSWVFRAAGFDEYHLATIALAPDGGYEFTRRTVKGGTAGPAASAPVRRERGGRQALTVRMRVSGDDFTVSIDGKQVDHWTDSRLTAGGVGFVGTPEDRARLYWVRLSYGGPVRSKS